MTALTLSRQQCLITLSHKAGDLIICGVYIGLFENAGFIHVKHFTVLRTHKSITNLDRLSLTSELYWKEYSLTTGTRSMIFNEIVLKYIFVK